MSSRRHTEGRTSGIIAPHSNGRHNIGAQQVRMERKREKRKEGRKPRIEARGGRKNSNILSCVVRGIILSSCHKDSQLDTASTSVSFRTCSVRGNWPGDPTELGIGSLLIGGLSSNPSAITHSLNLHFPLPNVAEKAARRIQQGELLNVLHPVPGA